jgi:hypothetical protein
MSAGPARRDCRYGGQQRRPANHAAAWRGEVNRSRRVWASPGRANSAALSACRAACVFAAQPTGWVGAHQRHGGEVEVWAQGGRFTAPERQTHTAHPDPKEAATSSRRLDFEPPLQG